MWIFRNGGCYSVLFFFFFVTAISGGRKQLVTCVGVVGDYFLDGDIYLGSLASLRNTPSPIFLRFDEKAMEVLAHTTRLDAERDPRNSKVAVKDSYPLSLGACCCLRGKRTFVRTTFDLKSKHCLRAQHAQQRRLRDI